ncbi:MAG: response regulator, partial [Methylococcales bacterium]|nr:response regulator [Methylococcales bacterium]
MNSHDKQYLKLIADQFREPINSIVGFSDVLKSASLKKQQRQSINSINQSGHYLKVVLDDFLYFSGESDIAPVFSKTEFKLRQVVQSAVEQLEPKIHHKNLFNRVTVDKTIAERFMGDAIRLQEVIVLLISNALANTSSGSIDVNVNNLKTNKSYCSLQVMIKSTSQSLSDEEIQCFNNGQRESNYNMVGRLLKMMGSQLIIENLSEGGVVACFDIELEMTRKRHYDFFAEPDGGDTTVDFDPSQCQILIVEDDLINQAMIKSLLEKQNYKLSYAANGLEALLKIDEENFDLILMDLSMPDMDGYEASQKIRQIETISDVEKPIPIVALTGAIEDSRQKCLDAGMNDYLSKPVRLEELLKV